MVNPDLFAQKGGVRGDPQKGTSSSLNRRSSLRILKMVCAWDPPC